MDRAGIEQNAAYGYLCIRPIKGDSGGDTTCRFLAWYDWCVALKRTERDLLDRIKERYGNLDKLVEVGYAVGCLPECSEHQNGGHGFLVIGKQVARSPAPHGRRPRYRRTRTPAIYRARGSWPAVAGSDSVRVWASAAGRGETGTWRRDWPLNCRRPACAPRSCFQGVREP